MSCRLFVCSFCLSFLKEDFLSTIALAKKEGCMKGSVVWSLDHLGTLLTTAFTDIQLDQGHGFKEEKIKDSILQLHERLPSWLPVLKLWWKYLWLPSFSPIFLERIEKLLNICLCICVHTHTYTCDSKHYLKMKFWFGNKLYPRVHKNNSSIIF